MSEAEADTCFYGSCTEPSRIVYVLSGRRYGLCEKHSRLINEWLKKLCQKHGYAELSWIEVEERDGRIRRIKPAKHKAGD